MYHLRRDTERATGVYFDVSPVENRQACLLKWPLLPTTSKPSSLAEHQFGRPQKHMRSLVFHDERSSGALQRSADLTCKHRDTNWSSNTRIPVAPGSQRREVLP